MDFTLLCRAISGCVEWWDLWPLVGTIGLVAACLGLSLEKWRR